MPRKHTEFYPPDVGFACELQQSTPQGLVLPERLTFKGMPCRLWVSCIAPDSSELNKVPPSPRVADGWWPAYQEASD